MKNLNLLFNKTYYEKLGTKEFRRSLKKNNLELSRAVFSSKDDYTPFAISDHTFLLEVCPPGLMVGLGYAHNVGEPAPKKDEDADSEVAVGFSFDYVTGQPYIPGSSVKGILRSHFKERPELVSKIIGLSQDKVGELEKEIFEYSDAFFDAVVFDGDSHGELIGFDYITPHKSPVEDPVPIRTLRILPGVRLEFRFKLQGDEKDVEKKLELFKTLLCFMGAGAKTNVGYGYLKETDAEVREKTERSQSEAPANREQRHSTQPASESRQAQNRENQKEVTEAYCNACNAKNFKYKYGTKERNSKWPMCYKCGERLADG